MLLVMGIIGKAGGIDLGVEGTEHIDGQTPPRDVVLANSKAASPSK